MSHNDDHEKEHLLEDISHKQNIQFEDHQVKQADAHQIEYDNDAGIAPTVLTAPYFSISLIVCLIIVFICQLIANNQHPDYPNGSWSIIIAGFVKQFFTVGEYWRILTASVLHSGIAHIGFNAYAVYILGKVIEQLSNRFHLAIIFLFSAICGGILSLIFMPETPSVGASGGIVGFLGYLTVYGYKRRKILPEGFLKNMLTNIGILAVTGLVLMSNIDNWAHLGGLIFGAVYGFVQIPSDLYQDPREVGDVTKIVGYISAGIILLTVIFTILLLLGIINIPFPVITGFSD